jgi:hypothetical protein
MDWLGRVFSQLHDAIDNGWYMQSSHELMRQTERGIDEYDIEDAICADRPEIIRNSPDHWRGPAVLILGWVHYRPLHIVCTIDTPPTFVTCYHPDPKRWDPGFKVER